MMKFTLPLRKGTLYCPLVWRKSEVFPGVEYAIRRVSLGQRIELTKAVRELALRNEFLKAAEIPDQMEAALADLLIKKLYLQWGLVEIRGLTIDGKPATPERLVDGGPEALADEIVSGIRAELELSTEERKNF
jgi:hypothetical protein